MRKLILTFCVASFLIVGYSCQSNKSNTEESDLSPVNPSDEGRYNINADDEAVIDLDSTSVDSVSRDSLPKE